MRPAERERCLRRLRALGALALRYAHGDDGAATVDIGHISAAANDLLTLTAQASAVRRSVWVSIGEDQHAGFVALYCLALRRCVAPDAAPQERKAYSEIRAAIAKVFRLLLRDDDVGFRDAAALRGTLLRAQTFHCYSQVLARGRRGFAAFLRDQDATAAAAAAAAAGDGGGLLAEDVGDGDVNSQTRAQLQLEGALRALMLPLCEICDLLHFFHEVDNIIDRDLQRKYHASPLIKELQSSRVLEHWAVSLLLVSAVVGTEDDTANLVARMGLVLESLQAQTPTIRFDSGVGTAAGGSRGLPYLAAAQAVSLAAALDGGTVYGMRSSMGAALPDVAGRWLRPSASGRADVWFAEWALGEWAERLCNLRKTVLPPCQGGAGVDADAPARSLRAAAVRRREELRRLIAELQAGIEAAAGSMIYVPVNRMWVKLDLYQERLDKVEGLLAAIAAPPYHVAATLDVSMRLAACALDAVRSEEAKHQQHQEQGASAATRPSSSSAAMSDWQASKGNRQRQAQQQQRVRIAQGHAVWLGLRALRCAREALWDVGWAAEADTPPDKLAQLDRWWALMAAFLPLAISQALREVDEWRSIWTELPGLLALREGESLAGPTGPSLSSDVAAALRVDYPRMLELLLRRCGEELGPDMLRCSGVVWGQLLAHGPLSEVAALMSTVAKTLRSATSRLASGDKAFQDTIHRDDSRPRCAADMAPLRKATVPSETIVQCLICSAAFPAAPGCSAINADPAPYGSAVRWLGVAATAAAAAVAPPSSSPPIQHDGAAGEGGGGCAAVAAAGEAILGGDAPAVQGQAQGVMGAVRPQPQRLGLALSHAAVRLLPDASRVVRQLARGWDDNEAALSRCLSWVPLLAAAAAAEPAAAVEPKDLRGLTAVTAATASWDRLLWVDVQVAELLDLSLRLLGGLWLPDFAPELGPNWVAALRALLHFAPQRLAALLAEQKSRDPNRGAPGRAFTCAPVLSMRRVRRVLGPGGAAADAELLEALERAWYEGRRKNDGGGAAPAPAAAAAADGAGDAGALPGDADGEWRRWSAAAALLVPPSEVRAALPTCDNPVCLRRDGESEAGVRLMGCGRCGGRVQYCCKACQSAHWKAGHKEECAGSAAAASSAAAAAAAVGSSSSGSSKR